jgi:hypothetical protein
MVKKILQSSIAAVSLALAPVAYAADIDINPQSAGFKITDLGKLINSLLKVTLGIVGLLVFIYLIWGGVEWITAGGDKSKTESARQKLTNAIIGLAIVAAAFAISAVLSQFFGVSVGTGIDIPKPY